MKRASRPAFRVLPFAVCLLALTAVRAADENLPRNPFWPQGHEGMRYPITLEPRFFSESEEPEEAAAATESNTNAVPVSASKAPNEDEQLWKDAAKALRFGSTMHFEEGGKTQAAIVINGLVYAVGDLVSANVDDSRFTWRIVSLSSDGKIKLKRMSYRKIGKNQ